MSSILKPVLGSQLNFGHPLLKGLGGYWLFNEGSGNLVQDSSGNGNTGTFVGSAPSWTSGRFGSAVLLPGTDEYISLAKVSPFKNDNKGTIVIWFYPRSSTNEGRIFWSGATDTSKDALAIIYQSNTEIRIEIRLTAGYEFVKDTINTFAVDNWYQLALVQDGISPKLYINGVLESTGDVLGPNDDTAWFDNVEDAAGIDLAVFGMERDSAPGEVLDAIIGGSMIYNRPLTAFEIISLYREPFCTFERDPIELWAGAASGVPVGNAGIMTTNTGYWGPIF